MAFGLMISGNLTVESHALARSLAAGRRASVPLFGAKTWWDWSPPANA